MTSKGVNLKVAQKLTCKPSIRRRARDIGEWVLGEGKPEQLPH
jgi:hypothetical protein